jgi:hypothetical protein
MRFQAGRLAIPRADIRFRLERPIQVRRSSLGLPGRPAVDVGVQLPDCAQWRIDVDLLAHAPERRRLSRLGCHPGLLVTND